MIELIRVSCPYCGEQFDTQLDLSAGSQRYTEDCQVCCQPIEFIIEVGLDGNLLETRLQREDD